ncbi:hypothetical protein AcV5_003542 [Taiwanofungus camphoratus]|nr:hypothetical protein AcV5_003542 [Antrodia cinnamomea]
MYDQQTEADGCDDSFIRQPHTPHSPPGPTSRFATSSVRDEPYTPPPPCPTIAPRSESLKTPPVVLAPPQPSSSAAYSVKRIRELVPGVLEDGRVTVNHPMIDNYLLALARAYQGNHAQLGTGPSPMLTDKKGKAGLSRVQNVRALLGMSMELNALQSECIVALAALKVYGNPRHLAHFALWDKKVRNRTAQVVHNIVYHDPPVIHSPIAWIGTKECLWVLDHLQALTYPPGPREKQQDGRTLRKRKASVLQEQEDSQTRGKGKQKEAHEPDIAFESPRKRIRKSMTSEAPAKQDGSCIQTRSQKRSAAAMSEHRIVSTQVPGTITSPHPENKTKLERLASPVTPTRSRSKSNVPTEGITPKRATPLKSTPEPARRSSRQAQRKLVAATGSTLASTVPAPASTPVPITPSSSSSSARSESLPSRGSSTAVSEGVSDGTIAVDEPEEDKPVDEADAGSALKKPKGKRKASGIEPEEDEKEQEDSTEPLKKRMRMPPAMKRKSESASTTAKTGSTKAKTRARSGKEP